MTNEPNQKKTEKADLTYDTNVAFEFFELFGKTMSTKQGEKIFERGQKTNILSFLQSDKTYLLVEGKVRIETAAGNLISVQTGNIFGEFTPYNSNNSTATAEQPCKLLSLNEKQFMSCLEKKPDFLFILINRLFDYLQRPETKAEDVLLLTESQHDKYETMLTSKMIDELKQRLDDDAFMTAPEQRVLFREGAAALLMYVILDGYVMVVANNKILAKSGPGDIIGELALIAQRHSRTASVVTGTRCSLLGINRQMLLELIRALPHFGIALFRVAVAHWCVRYKKEIIN